MSYNYIVDNTTVNFTYGNAGREYIVIHYTGNSTDTAKANANYFRNVNRNASAHFFVDDNDVVEVVNADNTAWAVGVNYGGQLFGICNNSNSLSIEMCSTNSEISDETFNNTIELTRNLMSQYGIPTDNVVRHYDVCGKSCPGWNGWIPPNETIWNDFKSKLNGSIEPNRKEETNMQCFYTKNNQAPVIFFDGVGFHPLADPDEVNILNQIYRDNNGRDIPSYNWNDDAPWFVRLEDAINRKM